MVGMLHFNTVRYVIKMILYCNFFSLIEPVVNDRGNFTLPISEWK